jgi:GTP-binding protein
MSAAPFEHPATYEEAARDRGRLLFAGPCSFVVGAARLEQLPPADRPEIAFAGRSNVGKSSLVNALTGRSTLARTSNTPGRTQQLNVFELGEGLRLVDMPGYGYAEAPKALVEAWTALVRAYLRGRPNLARVFVLVDARHGPKRADDDAFRLLDEAAASYQVVLTKMDKLRPGERARRLEATREAIARRPAAHPLVMPTSAEKGWGVAELRAEIAALPGVG